MPIPPAARLLGFAGLLPFLGAATALLLADGALRDVAAVALPAYGAVILSFLGGVRWGLAMAAAESARLPVRLAISVVPSLAGWVALLLPGAAGLALLAAGFAAMLALDLRDDSAPGWYATLRLPLSIGAIAALLAGMAG